MDLWEYLKGAEKPIVLYGMGNGADKIIKVLDEYGIEFKGVFASSGFVRNKLFHGFPIESYDTLKNRFGQMIVLLCFGTHLPEVMENIKRIAKEQELYAPDVPVVGDGLLNFELCRNKRDELEKVYSLLADEKSKQAFENILRYRLSGDISYLFDCETNADEPYDSFLKLENAESFLDLGAYNGDTALEFANRCPEYSRIIAVEPDAKTFNKLQNNTNNLENIRCLNVCVSDFTGKGHFSMKGGRNSVVGVGVETEFSTVDDILKGENITFIKMDVEGEELKAVKGAKKTILKYKPKMIISAYHRTEDFWTLPQAVLEINPEYKVYMRHFPSLPAWDTVYYFM